MNEMKSEKVDELLSLRKKDEILVLLVANKNYRDMYQIVDVIDKKILAKKINPLTLQASNTIVDFDNYICVTNYWYWMLNNGEIKLGWSSSKESANEI